MSLFDTGIRPIIDKHLLDESKKVRDYGEYWSASSAGYCMRKLIFERLGVPFTVEDARKQRVFSVGHIFHEWIQRLTKEAGLSVAQEEELTDTSIMVRGHFDDLVFIDGRFILYDYKTQNSRAFGYKHDDMSHYHRMQLGTYLYMVRRQVSASERDHIDEGRILKISKDDLRMTEQQLLWTPELEKDIVGYWSTLNGYWKHQKFPKCTCDKYEGGFMAREKFNPYWFNDKPCSLEWYRLWQKEKANG